MAQIPELKDWRGLLEERLNKVAYTEEDILQILYLCQDYLVEIQPAGQWMGQQQGFINQMQRIFNEMYLKNFTIEFVLSRKFLGPNDLDRDLVKPELSLLLIAGCKA